MRSVCPGIARFKRGVYNAVLNHMKYGTITIVSGLPRSGTSMMMRMLAAGGIEPLIDNIRTPDEDNPKGYFEFEKVKQIEKDQTWLEDAKGRVVKMISALLRHLPAHYNYRVIFMRRNMSEILASQRQMLVRRGEPTDKVGDDKMADMFKKHVAQVEAWLASQPNIKVLYISYNDVLASPSTHIQSINRFLGGDLNVEAMAGVVDRALYRQQMS
jgi:sulfotransferase family protein